MKVSVVHSLADIKPEQWDGLLTLQQPFLSHTFLYGLERTGCVGAGTGWAPAHIVVLDENNSLQAAMPGWLKQHSRGEYVFDQAWAEGAYQAGIAYYPKWLSAVPFSPITGPRVFGRSAAIELLLKELVNLPKLAGLSSWHINFTNSDSNTYLSQDPLWLLRHDCQFHWRNQNYQSFDDFLALLTSDRRKKIRQERRKVALLDLSFEWCAGDQLSPEIISQVYDCYNNTYAVRGQLPYLTPEFFSLLCQQMGQFVRVLLVRRQQRVIAMALFIVADNTLYGRYWGALEDVPLLHFEVCFYRGIEYAISQGLSCFDPGAQGEHKLIRGFEPVLTNSWHRFQHPGLQQAVADFLQRERIGVERYQAAALAACPYKKTGV